MILSEVSQAQKAKNHMFSLICERNTANTNTNTEIQVTLREVTYEGGEGKRRKLRK
jgi:hypothetical protein